MQSDQRAPEQVKMTGKSKTLLRTREVDLDSNPYRIGLSALTGSGIRQRRLVGCTTQ